MGNNIHSKMYELQKEMKLLKKMPRNVLKVNYS